MKQERMITLIKFQEIHWASVMIIRIQQMIDKNDS